VGILYALENKQTSTLQIIETLEKLAGRKGLKRLRFNAHSLVMIRPRNPRKLLKGDYS
jgi:hypothetical protein